MPPGTVIELGFGDGGGVGRRGKGWVVLCIGRWGGWGVVVVVLGGGAGWEGKGLWVGGWG